ncbi:MAG TPA: cytochrome c [Reyranella sp.]|jgi:mono/diheme cytochrome c family protein
MLRAILLPVLIALASLPAAGAVYAADPILSPGFRFSEQTGEALYTNVCQACHMGNGEGATGAGRYPSLVKNPKLETDAEALYVILHGQGAMPPVGRLMTDDQVAAVVTYIRTHFGNNYKEPVTADAVKKAR